MTAALNCLDGLVIGEGADANTQGASALQNSYDDLYLTEQPYGLVCEVVTGFPVSDSSSAALT